MTLPTSIISQTALIPGASTPGAADHPGYNHTPTLESGQWGPTPFLPSGRQGD
ncbi:hypothetical protein D187_008900 [Cystobacter fuscus DSM 2262]|uniref:Uncharacterized protein n=1 Tax=Cystobacter fuscus (strain ATCC 25194 / DSM 2262 / NBRC 100088 / M29) TaxID=1242864 RepID=S9PJV0_CYSF2|nr:hypothetical protein D187_008900 [Cystobacter fuscus DSM 2262]